MKRKCFIFFLSAFLAITVSFIVYSHLPFDHENTEADNKDIYYGSEKINLLKLNDPLFTDSEYAYNHNLAIESFKLAVSAFSANVSDSVWGEDAYVGREDNVKKFFTDYEYDDIAFFGYDKGLNDDSSKTAFAIGKKIYNHDTSIVAIAVRGGNYGLEWADNFNIGDSGYDYHRGFYEAAVDIKNKADKYISEFVNTKNIKLWITGYSRGGAVANLLASMYDKNKEQFPCQVYAYTFASPKSALIDATSAHDIIYRNIFNILSPNDPIYNIPPAKWGFGRFGICVIFPDNNSLDYEGAAALNRKVAKSYYFYTGEVLAVSADSVNSFINIMIKSSESRDFFARNISKPVSDLITVKMSRYKNNSGQWKIYERDDILMRMYGNKATETLSKIQNNDFFLALKNLGIKLPDDFYTFITLCHINGFTKYEDTLFSNINVGDMNDISYITSSDLIYTGHRNEFYRSWLENVSVSVLKFSKE